MIGQDNLRSLLIEQSSFGVLPHFIGIVGAVGSGRKTLVDNVFNVPNQYIKFEDCKIDTIRELVDLSYRLKDMYFFIPDIDSMSIGAQNALLKVVEETPNNNYYIVSLEDRNNILTTLNSRISLYCMEVYRRDDFIKYCEVCNLDSEETDIVINLCDNFGEINTIVNYGVREFYEYMKLVVDNIISVSLGNAMKVSEIIETHDLKLFFKAFLYILVDKLKSGELEYEYWYLCKITSKYMQELRLVGVNKQYVFDSWLFEMREWYGNFTAEV